MDFYRTLFRFDKRNCWNADIVAAARELLPKVSDPSITGSLIKLIEDLTPQSHPLSRKKPVPSRQRIWTSLHELSLTVLRGLGVNYNKGYAHAPGYLVPTWRVWEDLLTMAAKIGFGASTVESQKSFPLGAKIKTSSGINKTISVFPDCLINLSGSRSKIILDAKYKGHIERGKLSISNADIYEALAFSQATNCNQVVLAYPAQSNNPLTAVGTCNIFEKVKIGAVNIIGIQIECRLISARNGLRLFSSNMAKGITFALYLNPL